MFLRVVRLHTCPHQHICKHILMRFMNVVQLTKSITKLIRYVLAFVPVYARKQVSAGECICATRPHAYTSKTFNTCTDDGMFMCHQDVHMNHANAPNPLACFCVQRLFL